MIVYTLISTYSIVILTDGRWDSRQVVVRPQVGHVE